MPKQPTEAELEILQVLWQHEPATVRFVHEQLEKKRQVGYTTILKQMQRMHDDKQLLTREKRGKTHYYTANLKQEEVKSSSFNKIVNTVFKGSAMDLIMHALGKAETTPEEIETLEKWIQQQKDKTNE